MFELVIDKRKIGVRRREKITAGSVGIRTSFEFSQEWNGLGKTAVFETDKHKIAVALNECTVTVPWEVCEEAGLDVIIGVYGTNADGSIVIPTVWAKLDTVSPGADTQSADNSQAPTATELQQILSASAAAVDAARAASVSARSAAECAADVKARADNGEFNGRDGAPLTVADRVYHISTERPDWETLILSDGSELDIMSGKNGRDGKDYDHSAEYEQLADEIDGYREQVAADRAAIHSSVDAAALSADTAIVAKDTAVAANDEAALAKQGAITAEENARAYAQNASSAAQAATEAAAAAVTAETEAQSAADTATAAAENAKTAADSVPAIVEEVRAEQTRLSESISEISKSVDNSVYVDFIDGEGWAGTVGTKIRTDRYDLVSRMGLINARVGDRFRLKTYGVGGWAKRYYELDENMIVLYAHEGTQWLDSIIEISDINTKYLAVNKGNREEFACYRYTNEMEHIAQNKANIEQNSVGIAENKATLTSKMNISYEKGEAIGEIKDGLFNAKTKRIEFTGSGYRYIELEVNFSDKLYLTGISYNDGSVYPFVVFVDANGDVLDTIKSDKKDALFIDYNLIIQRADVKKLYINGSSWDNHIGAFGAKEVDVYERVGTAVDMASNALSKVNNTAWNSEKVAESVINEQKKNPFAWGTFDKGAIVFTFDDSLADIDLVESLSEEYGVPVCFSSIPSTMNNTTTATGNNKKVHEVLTIAEAHGNEVLCHSGVALSETSTDEEVYTNFVTNKKLLEEYGYSVNGIIEAGSGGGELTFDTKRSEKYLRILYEYSDHYGRNLDMPQYDTGRTYINRNIQNNHNVVDSCERNKTLLIFATHSVTDESTSSINTSESILRDLMAYVKTKDVYLLTFKGAYDMFRSSVLENRIKALEN